MKLLLWLSTATLAVVGLIVHDGQAHAHHASEPFYDQEKEVEAVGTVERFLFRNPHSFLYVKAPSEDGTIVEWEIEMGASVSMSRRGWTPDTIKAGDEIRVIGRPSRAEGTFGMCCAELSRPDGSPIRP